MKTYLSYSLILAAAASGMASGAETAYTTPVGYVTKVLAPNQFNLMGVTVQQSGIAAGVLDAESASPKSVTDNEINFTTALTAGKTYILELPNGVIQEITTWSGSVLTTPDDITASVVPGVTTYKLRLAATISDIFGATNSAGLTPSVDGGTTACDTVQLYNGAGFDVVLYVNDGAGTQGWFTEGGAPAATKPIVYADGVYVRRTAGAPINLVVSGEIKTKPTSGVLATGFNYLGAVAPVGLTLLNSGLQNFITPSPDGNATTSDSVQIQIAGGAYRVCMYIAGAGWFDEGGNPADAAILDSGCLIMNRGAARPYTISVPTSYGNF